MTIGKRLAEIRVEHGFSQASFARQVGCSTKTILNYENDKRDLPIRLLKTLITKYSVTADWILFGTGPRDIGVFAEAANAAIRAASIVAGKTEAASAVEFGNMVYEHHLNHGPLDGPALVSLAQIVLVNANSAKDALYAGR